MSGLVLCQNILAGAIPAELGGLPQLQWLELWGNQLGGSIPPQLGDLAEVHQMALAFNHLEGSIPEHLGDLSRLVVLTLSSNRLSGPVPAHLGDLPRLEVLSLSNNQLSGAVPAKLCDPPYGGVGVTPLNLRYNALTSGSPCLYADDPDWDQTQTVAPTGVHAVLAPPRAAQLTWTPVPYTGDGGYYEICSTASPGGALTRHGAT